MFNDSNKKEKGKKEAKEERIRKIQVTKHKEGFGITLQDRQQGADMK